ncbi:MAG: hypothetical protein LBR91_01680 [Puniceicoccales bacterium]|jgi:hypothetical protein|nr:hypothetical protein [Puniceicoccales bacterium]
MSDGEVEVDGGKSIDLSELKNFSLHAKFEDSKFVQKFSERSRWREKPRESREGGGFGNKKGRSFGGASFSGGQRKGFGGRSDGQRQTGDNRRSGDRPHGPHGRGNERSGNSQPRRSFGDGQRNGWNFRGRNFNNKRDGDVRQRFDPIVGIEFYPNDEVFDAIVAALKATSKTYELFATARLFLEKPERFAMVVKKKELSEDKSLYLCSGDGFVFETEEQAVGHALENCLEKYFDIEEREVPAPNGSFPCIHRCGITGKILCPPNYHTYHEVVRNHHEKFLPNVPFKKFKDSIEKITDKAEIENWRLAAGKARVFVPKSAAHDNKAGLTSDSDVRKYFVENLKSNAVMRYDSVRISGEAFAKMPRSLLSKSIFVSIEREKSFPLKFSNNLRGRLRRAGFTIYKIGGKSGIAYISGIRRKFRTVGDVFSDDVQKIISCIDANPKISIASLCLQCIPGSEGVSLEKSGPMEEQGPRESESATERCESEVRSQEFLKNLHWLIREGYVAEFEDGTLMATEIMQPRKRDVKDGKPVTKGEDGSEELSGAGNENQSSASTPHCGDSLG